MNAPILDFLAEPENSHAKESILKHRLLLDLKSAAAHRGYYLNTYFDAVDHDGFDVIFDDKDTLIKTQIKSVGAAASTGSWKIHKNILRPEIGQLDKLGLESSPEGEGYQGGVILMEYYEKEGSLYADYFYTDVYILLAFEHKFLCRTHVASEKAVEKCLREWRKGLGKERLTVPRAAFLKAKCAEALLALMGLHGRHDSSWQWLVTQLVNHADGDQSIELAAPEAQLKECIWGDISPLLNDPKLAGTPKARLP